MHHSEYLYDILVFLSATVIIIPIFKRLGLSPILGFLFIGIIIGPKSFALIKDTDVARKFAEFGVVFLLFMIGLELSIERLKTLGKKVFGLGSLQVLVTGVIIAAIAWSFGFNLNAATIIGGGLALSSTAFVLQLLIERGERATPYGLTTFSILLLQDLAVVPLLLLVTILASPNTTFLSAFGASAIQSVLAILFVIAFGRFLLRPLFHAIAKTRNPELFISTTLLVVLGMGTALNYAGLSMELGALLAGVLLAETEFRHQIEADIRPFRGILLGLFFITIGMLIDINFIYEHLAIIALLSVSLMLGKSLIITCLCSMFAIPLPSALKTGLALSQGGEFGFVLFSAALATGLLSSNITQILLAVITITMALTPAMFYIGNKISSYSERNASKALSATPEDIETMGDHIFIAGFGRVGQTVAQVMSEVGISYVALDLDQTRVKKCRTKGLPVFFGDASKIQVIEATGISKASLAVITLDDPTGASIIVDALRKNYPDLPIYVRAKNRDHIQKLEQVGATAVVSEAAESSLQLGSIVLAALDVSNDEITSVIKTYRDNDYQRLQEIISA